MVTVNYSGKLIKECYIMPYFLNFINIKIIDSIRQNMVRFLLLLIFWKNNALMEIAKRCFQIFFRSDFRSDF